MANASRPPLPYSSLHTPTIHRGEITFTGSTTVDLRIKHNNYKLTLTLVGGLAAQNIAPHLSFARVSGKPGVFTITAGKYTSTTDNTIIAATAACTVSFVAEVGAPVE